MKKLIIVLSIVLTSCFTKAQTDFSEKALNDTFLSLEDKKVPFKDIINQYKGKKVVIDIWASWCGDCIKGMPKVEALQKQHPDAVYLFLSLDKTAEDWKAGIKKYNVKGEHYLMTSGWKGDFGSFVNLDWIPRYMVVDENGKISVFKEIHADDKNIKKALEK